MYLCGDSVWKLLKGGDQQVMRAQGLGVVIQVGPESAFSVGDLVSGPWGGTASLSFVRRS